MTGMSPMQVAEVTVPSAEENFSSHGRTLMSARRCGVSEPVQPESTAPRMTRSVDARAPRSSAAVSVSEAMRTRSVVPSRGGSHRPR